MANNNNSLILDIWQFFLYMFNYLIYVCVYTKLLINKIKNFQKFANF